MTAVPPLFRDAIDWSDSALALAGLRRGTRKSDASAPPPSARRRAGSRDRRMPEILEVDAWKRYPWLLHGFTTRRGGISKAYRAGDLNLGSTTADRKEDVCRNRELVLKHLSRRAGQTPQYSLLQQIHSGIIHPVGGAAQNAAEIDPAPRGDGLLTRQPGHLLTIQTADCIPVLVADTRKRIVGAFHAGWRGTLARIVERGIGRMRAEFGSDPTNLTAAIGPGIGGCCYAVGEEVRMEFESQFHYAADLFHEVFDLDPIKQKYPMLFLTARAPGHSNLGPEMHLDLIEANRRQLLDAGLAAEAIHSLGLCTACDPQRFFSYRAEQGFTGRMFSMIGIAPE
jgi:YfiH family protein